MLLSLGTSELIVLPLKQFTSRLLLVTVSPLDENQWYSDSIIG